MLCWSTMTWLPSLTPGLRPGRRAALLKNSRARTSGPVYVAIDLVGAGEGELVLVVSGSGARVSAESSAAPVDSAVVAIADSVIRNGAVTYRKS